MSKLDLAPIRYAKPEDYPHIIAIAENLHEENGHSKIHYPTAEAAIVEAINKNKALIGLIGPVGDIQGIVFLRFACFWYSEASDVFLEELFLFVPPAYRKTHNARALLEFANNAAKSLGVPLMIGVLSTARTKPKLRLYERVLGAPVGGYFYVGGVREKLNL